MSFKSIDTSNPIREDNIEKFVVPKSFVKPSGTSGLLVIFLYRKFSYLNVSRADTAGSSVMFVAALAAMTKNWTIAWPAIISAAICFVKYAPLKCSDTTSPLSSLFL